MPSPSTQPSLNRDPSFWGMAAAQFLGAFNDNIFKQLVLLLCVTHLAKHGADYQPLALAVFAIPFVCFSGFAGFLSDRYSKRSIIVLCKSLEIVIMLCGGIAFLMGGLNPEMRLAFLFVVLALMSTQSAYFGPSKYGVLPELFRESDLPAANGIFQMTTFIAIIFGMAAAGFARDILGENGLWQVSAVCVCIAAIGTVFAFVVRKTPAAKPDLKLQAESLFVSRETRHMLAADKPLLFVLLVSSLFWFIGGVIQPAVNDLGLNTLLPDGCEHLGIARNTRTSLLAACMGIGIAAGCGLAGKLSKHRIDFRLVKIGGWGLAACLGLVTWVSLSSVVPGIDVPAAENGAENVRDAAAHKAAQGKANGQDGEPDASEVANAVPPAVAEPILDLIGATSWKEGLCRFILIALGVFAGLFIVPLQVFMQLRPPKDQKGRMIGTMNLVNWLGIVSSAGFLGVVNILLEAMSISRIWLFAALAVLILPVTILGRFPQQQAADGS